jgi:hypothetical protein
LSLVFEARQNRLLNLWAAFGEVDRFAVRVEATTLLVNELDEFFIGELIEPMFLNSRLECAVEDFITASMLDGGGPSDIAQCIRVLIQI